MTDPDPKPGLLADLTVRVERIERQLGIEPEWMTPKIELLCTCVGSKLVTPPGWHEPQCPMHERGARVYHREIAKPVDRRMRFENTCGALGYTTKRGYTGANHHPDRCECQGSDPTPHKHYYEPPHSCARCLECKAYKPAIPDVPLPVDPAPRPEAEVNKPRPMTYAEVLQSIAYDLGVERNPMLTYDAVKALRTKLEAAERERDAYRRDYENELAGIAETRKLYGARNTETFEQFMRRLVAERDAALRERDYLRAKVAAAMKLADEWERTPGDCESAVLGCVGELRGALK